jgi:hypothetical protein
MQSDHIGGRFRRRLFFFIFGLINQGVAMQAANGAYIFYSLWLQWQVLGIQFTWKAQEGYMRALFGTFRNPAPP